MLNVLFIETLILVLFILVVVIFLLYFFLFVIFSVRRSSKLSLWIFIVILVFCLYVDR